MPKKNSKDGGEAKKRRTSSSTKEARNSSTTSPGNQEVLLPPTPTATHLVASNPFDDPPSNAMNNSGGPMMQGPSRMMMHSPLHNPGMTSPYGPVGPRPNWGSSPVGQHRPTRPYGSPGGPSWNGSGMMSPVGHMVPGYQPDPQLMSPTEYGYNRPMMGHPNPGHPMYRGPPRMMGRFGGSPPMNPERMMMPELPDRMRRMPHNGSPGQNMLVGPGGEMKVLTRPNLQTSIPQPLPTTAIRRSVSNMKAEKSSRNDNGSTTPKSKKKSKAAEAKLAKSVSSDADDKNWKGNVSGTGNKSNLSSPSGSGVTAPHAVPPVLPQACFQCHKDISAENCMCCLASCNKWYHLTCTGLTEAAYNCLRSEELALWACDNCLRLKEIDSVRLRDPVRPELPNSNSNGTGLPIVGKA